MTGLVTIEQVKEHLRITHSDEDNVINMYMESAQDWIENFLNTANPPQNASIKNAALLIVGALYENREAYSADDLKPNPAVTNLLYPYREKIGI